MSIIRPAVEMQGKDIKEIKSGLHSVKTIVTAIGHETNDHEKRIKRVEERVFV